MKTILLTAALALLAVTAPPTHAATKPNIILVMPDDLGYGDYSCLGNPIIKTPSVDAFWKQSVRLTDFHVSPTCAPTRSALMTGRHEFKNGVTHTILERERMTLKATTIAQVLKSAGYATGIFGKWHLGDEAAYQPNRRGFDEVFIHGGGGIGQTYPGSCGDAPGNKYANPAILHNGTFVKTEGYCTDLFFGHAIEWMDEKLDKGIPFFAYITPNAAHGPLQCPEEYERHWAGKVEPDVAKFFGMIENIDDNFGAMLAKLDEWGIAKNTLVIYLGTDNGGTAGVKVFNAGMHGGKGTPYQGGTRAPAMFRWPSKLEGGRDVPALTAHLDIFPTLAEIAGVPLDGDIAKQVEGRSLMPLLTNPKAEWPDRFLVTHVGRWPRGKVAEAKFTNCSIRDSRYTLVNNKELYDLQSDPGESKNVLDEHAAEAARLRDAYDKWWDEVQPMLVNENVVGPKVNPFKELYWKQFGGGPDDALRRRMDPETTNFQQGRRKPKAKDPNAKKAE
jgi:arylsulfatase